MKFSELPPLSNPLDGGIFAGLTTTRNGGHFAVVLLPNIPPNPLPWQAAMDWAQSVNGVLPTRPAATLLFANLNGEFQPEWYWTREQYSDRSAWFQNFDNGLQYDGDKSNEFQARAVRLIEVTA